MLLRDAMGSLAVLCWQVLWGVQRFAVATMPILAHVLPVAVTVGTGLLAVAHGAPTQGCRNVERVCLSGCVANDTAFAHLQNACWCVLHRYMHGVGGALDEHQVEWFRPRAVTQKAPGTACAGRLAQASRRLLQCEQLQKLPDRAGVCTSRIVVGGWCGSEF
jgi:hypothetical protein